MEEEANKPYGFIYITTNLINGKKYVGQKVFSKYYQTYLGSGVLLAKAIKKYGKENFVRETIATAYFKKELDSLKIEFIESYNATISKDYYNIAFGGDGGSTRLGTHNSEEHRKRISETNTGMHFSEEARKHMSEAHIGIQKGEKHPMFGKHHTEEAKRKIGESCVGELSVWFGKHHSAETKIKLSEGKRGNKNPMYGKQFSEEHKSKMSKSLKGRIVPDETKQKLSETHIGLLRKINENQADEIREKYNTGKYIKQKLSEEYNCDKKTIYNILHYKGTYKKII